jgi:prephenate dehydratase
MRIQSAKYYGIQGGRGSFNDQALRLFLADRRVEPSAVEVEYLYTASRVLAALRDGQIEVGQFAVHNSIGGPVQRSVEAMEEFDFSSKFQEIARHDMQISHCLMVHPEAELSEVEVVISHPAVFVQCACNLRTKYQGLKQTPGEGEMEDPARAGEAIANGSLPRTYATLSSIAIADICGLKVVERDLQDRNPNITTFVVATLPG